MNMKIHLQRQLQSENTHFIKESITVRLTSCLTGLNLPKRVNLLIVLMQQNSRIQTSQINRFCPRALCSL